MLGPGGMSDLHSSKGEHASHCEHVLGSQVWCSEQHHWRNENGDIEQHVGGRLRFVRSDEAIKVSESEAVAIRRYSAVPVPAHWKARKPCGDRKGDTPKSHSDEEANANPSHESSLENAEVLEQESNLDDAAVGDVYGHFEVVQLAWLASGITQLRNKHTLRYSTRRL